MDMMNASYFLAKFMSEQMLKDFDPKSKPEPKRQKRSRLKLAIKKVIK
ncbi:hypothetical protein [Vibrio mediterranei]